MNIFNKEIRSLIPGRNLWVNRKDSVQHFLTWPLEYRVLLQCIAGAQRNSRFLEIGCGHGRTALGLVDLISYPGSYLGFDCRYKQIKFAQKHYSKVNPRMKFVFVDAKNEVYNRNGKFDSDQIVFPSSDESIDVSFAASVFTHLLPNTVLNYLCETRRVLDQNGLACYSFFIYDNYLGRGSTISSKYDFEFKLQNGVHIVHPDLPELTIAYSLDLIYELARNSGLELFKIIPGYWSNNSKNKIHEQDLIFFKKLNSR